MTNNVPQTVDIYNHTRGPAIYDKTTLQPTGQYEFGRCVSIDSQYWRQPNYKRIAGAIEQITHIDTTIANRKHESENVPTPDTTDEIARLRTLSINIQYAVRSLVKQTAPSGSGIDNGTHIDWEASKPNKLVFTLGYHHMNDGGYYNGWTDHTCIVTPSLTDDIDIRITGRDRNDIKDYLHEVYYCWLHEASYTNKQWYQLQADAIVCW